MTRILLLLIFLSCLFSTYSQTPTAAFSATPLSVCAGGNVVFTSSSSTNGSSQIVSYVWDFGDGGPFGNGQTTSHVYTTPGPKTVTLTVTNSNGAADAEVKVNYITVLPSPVPKFSIAGIGCTVPLTLTFNNQSTGGNSYSWSFGNGQTSTVQSPPAQTYTSAGNYDAILTVTSSNGCMAKDTQTIVVSNFQADFILPNVGCIGQPISFQDNSTAGANTWNWSFDGLGASTDQNPNFTFNTAGTYTIQLSSQNTSSGCSANISKQITIQPTPTPSFSATPTSNCAPAVIDFTNSSQGGISYIWDFGDGQQYTGNTPPPHTYYVNGTYDVTLTMTTSTGCSGTLSLSDYIEVTDVGADFEADFAGGCNPLTVQFTDISTTPSPTNPIVSWNWTFGNGQTFNGQTPPSQVYTNGLFDVSLSVTTQSGCTGTITKDEFISVGQIKVDSITVDSLVRCVKKDYQFNSYVTTTPGFPDSTEINFYWDFSDGTSTDADPKHQFTSDTGYFDIQLIVEYRGCKDTLEIDSMVYILAPIAKFNLANDLFCNPVSFPITASALDKAIHGKKSDDIKMTWDWGDGTFTVLDDPQLDDGDAGNSTHQYSNYGTYTIEQSIYNYTTGCEDSITGSIDISKVIPKFILSSDTICSGDSLLLQDQSITWSNPPTPHPFSSWSFDTDNAATLSGDSVWYVYTNPDTYDITLTAANSVGCSADTTIKVVVLAHPFPSITADDISICSHQTVVFTNNSVSLSGLPLTSFEYYFTDDSSTVVMNSLNSVSHTFIGQGLVSTAIKVSDQFGCYSEQSIDLMILKPTAQFDVQNVICNNDSINADNLSTGSIPLTYNWLIDGTSISANEDVDAYFSEPNVPFGQTSQTHILSLVATDIDGCKDTLTDTITVSIPWAIPTYKFTGAAVNAQGEFYCPPIFGAYVDSSISFGDIKEWNWDFGNTNFSSLEKPNNTYALPGVYSLTLTVTDEYGCVGDTTFVDYVAIGGPSGEPTWAQNNGQCVQGANFTILNAVNVDSTIWEMGDNSLFYDSITFQYNYSDPGTYSPGVTLIDTGGCAVYYPLNPVTVLDDGLTAFFTATPAPADENQIISFIDGSTSVASSIVDWTWDFGEDTVFSLQNNTQYYSYPTAGYYTISLTVTDALGCEATYKSTIYIKDPEIWLPNVITANNDGTNENFVLPFDAFKEFTVVILNRWGNVMRTGHRDPSDPTFMWDGTDQTGVQCTDGVYFYRLTGEMLGGTYVDKHGFVTVIHSKQ